tara:strand:- start:77 stop:373 length:297 start_codon:yes stop_codon:yes gene_type:complete
MNRKQFISAGIALLVSSTLSFGQDTNTDERKQCVELTKKNTQCKNKAINDKSTCYLHTPNYKKLEVTTKICSGKTKTGNKCKSKTKDISGKCHHHRND